MKEAQASMESAQPASNGGPQGRNLRILKRDWESKGNKELEALEEASFKWTKRFLDVRITLDKSIHDKLSYRDETANEPSKSDSEPPEELWELTNKAEKELEGWYEMTKSYERFEAKRKEWIFSDPWFESETLCSSNRSYFKAIEKYMRARTLLVHEKSRPFAFGKLTRTPQFEDVKPQHSKIINAEETALLNLATQLKYAAPSTYTRELEADVSEIAEQWKQSFKSCAYYQRLSRDWGYTSRKDAASADGQGYHRHVE